LLKFQCFKIYGTCCSYFGGFTIDYRNLLLEKTWHLDLFDRKVPITNPLLLNDLLTSEIEISTWNSQGLPSNDLSIQNGILTTKGSRFPLCVDPQLQVRIV
jgi:dynein heavy chain